MGCIIARFGEKNLCINGKFGTKLWFSLADCLLFSCADCCGCISSLRLELSALFGALLLSMALQRFIVHFIEYSSVFLNLDGPRRSRSNTA